MKKICIALLFMFAAVNCFALTPKEVLEKAWKVNVYGVESKIGAHVIEIEAEDKDNKDSSRSIMARYVDAARFRFDAYGINKDGEVAGTSFIKNKDGAFMAREAEMRDGKVAFPVYIQFSKAEQQQEDGGQQGADVSAQQYRAFLGNVDMATLEMDSGNPDFYVITSKNRERNRASQGFRGAGKNYAAEASGQSYLFEVKQTIDKKTFNITGYELQFDRDAVKMAVESSEEYKKQSDKKKAAYLEKKTNEIVNSYNSKTTLSDFRKVAGTEYIYPYMSETVSTNAKKEKSTVRIKTIRFEKLTPAQANTALTPESVKSLKAAIRDDFRESRGKKADSKAADSNEEVTNDDIKKEVQDAAKEDIKDEAKSQARRDVRNSIRRGAFGF